VHKKSAAKLGFYFVIAPFFGFVLKYLADLIVIFGFFGRIRKRSGYTQ
jgi:hypothetical protein